MTIESGAGTQPGVLTLDLSDPAALYAAYMPFIHNGGLFVPLERETAADTYSLGDEVFLLLRLAEQGERVPIAGTVVWITPAGAQGQRVRGIGVQFSNRDGGGAQRKIETLLAGALDSERPTQTL